MNETATLLTASPLADSFNNALAAGWRRGAEAAGARVLAFDVSQLRIDPVLRDGHRSDVDDEDDLAAVRAAVTASVHVTWVFPLWWVGLPAALKALVDRLFLPGWAFRYDGAALPTGLLAGRSSRYITTMDSPSWWYRLANHDALAGSFGRGTLRFVGFAPVTRSLVFNTRKLDEAARARAVVRAEADGADDIARCRRR